MRIIPNGSGKVNVPLVIPPGFSNVTLVFDGLSQGQLKRMTTNFGVSAPPDETTAQLIYSAYAGDVWTTLGSNLFTFLSVEMRNVAVAAEYSDVEVGTVNQEPIPPNTAVLLQKRTGLIGRSNRGRMYPPGLSYDGTWDGGGQMSDSNLATYQGCFDDFMASLGTIGAEMVVLHTDSSDPTPVQNLVVARTAATQRRRLR